MRKGLDDDTDSVERELNVRYIENITTGFNHLGAQKVRCLRQ